MKKPPQRIKEVVYTLSPFEQSVFSGLWKNSINNGIKLVKEVITSILFI